MQFRKILPAFALAFALTGCTATVPKNPDGSLERPTDVEVIFAATNAFRHLRGRSPVDPQIDSLKIMKPFISQEEYVACISVEEKRIDAVYNLDGSVKHPIGGPVRYRYAMLLRKDDGPWYAGLFKEAHHLNSFGALKMHQICEE